MSDIVDARKLEQTGSVKLTLRGKTDSHIVYRIPLDILYYNDWNGRILSFMTQYNVDHPNTSEISKEEKNKLIQEEIKNVNGIATFRDTLKSIENFGQRLPGVVLSDGRVIDGNRRFTCLRELYYGNNAATKGDAKFFYFEAAILPAPEEGDKEYIRAIKELEYQLQKGTDEKVDYTALNNLIQFYFDVVKPETRFFDKSSYLRNTGYSSSDFDKNFIKATIMADMLHFFGKDEQFNYFNELKLKPDGGIQEMVPLYKKLKDDPDEWNRVKVLPYVMLWSSGKVDKRERIRQIVNEHKNNDQLFEKQLVRANGVAERLLSQADLTGSVGAAPDSWSIKETAEIISSVEQNKEISAREKVISRPLELVKGATENLKEIDIDVVANLQQDAVSDLLLYLDELSKAVDSEKAQIQNVLKNR
jgi:hypothetical protein